jgi:conjugative transfer signal peptidase TraF
MAAMFQRGRAAVVGQDKGNGSLRPGARDFLRPLPALSEGRSGSQGVIVTRTAPTANATSSAPRVALRNPFGTSQRNLRRIGNAALLTLIELATFAVLGSFFNLRITLTDSSTPAGVYRLVAGAPIRRGVLVAACLPQATARQGLTRGYLRRGDCPAGAEPVAKLIGALPGDAVTVEPGGVAVNDVNFRHSQVAAHDSAGRPLAHVPFGPRSVSSGEVWLFGFNDARSWDSRYFGPIPFASICGSLKPLITW